MRLDKWLWCARLYKTRAEAVEAVNAGRVRQDGHRIKPSRAVSPGETFTVRRGPYTWTLTDRALTPRRLPAAAATALYEETAESAAAREAVKAQLQLDKAQNPATSGRPTKRERRKLIRFQQKNQEPRLVQRYRYTL